MNHPHSLPSTHHYPDPNHFEALSRLGDEITELAAHLDAGEYEFLSLIGTFDESELEERNHVPAETF